MKTEYVWTEDQLRLMGIHYPGSATCVLEVHGMSGNFLENYYANVLGEELASQGIGFLYGHNRGYGHLNYIATGPTNPENNGWHHSCIGVVNELFEDCLKDISGWIAKARELGYRRIVLLGHSLGCNKVIYYLSQNSSADIVGVILASPPDMVGLVELERYQPNHQELLTQARSLVAAEKPRQILDGRIWDEYDLSAQTYLSLFETGGPADNLPVLRNPEVFAQLATIKQPILGLMGEHDDIEIRELKADIELIKSKAIASQDFRIEFIPGANHDYENREPELAEIVTRWVCALP